MDFLSAELLSGLPLHGGWRQSECMGVVSKSFKQNYILVIKLLFLLTSRQLNRWPCHSLTHSLSEWVRHLLKNTTTEWPQRLVTLKTFNQRDEETWPDQKKTMTKTNTKTKTMTKTNTFREHLQRAILETCDLWDIWSEWWGDMTWPTKRQWQRQIQRQRQRQSQRQMH